MENVPDDLSLSLEQALAFAGHIKRNDPVDLPPGIQDVWESFHRFKETVRIYNTKTGDILLLDIL